ncbi:MAG: glycosyltransferase [Cyanobacteria bacterium J06632_22]
MARIALFLSALDDGGAERVMINLARGFADQGHRVDLILSQAVGPYLSQLPSTVSVIDFQQPRLIQSIAPLARYLKEQSPEMLIAALEDTNLVALWAHALAKLTARISTRVVVTVHNTLSEEIRHAHNWKRRLVPRVIPLFYRWADAVVCVSQGVANDLQRLGVPAERCRVIYNPITTPELVAAGQAAVAHPWLQPDFPEPVCIAVGRLSLQKNFSLLLSAFARLCQRRSARLLVLGEGPDRQRLFAEVEQLGLTDRVDFPGFVENPYAHMAKAAVLVLSSQWEGFGNVLVEAMAVGTSVVATDCPHGPAEVLAQGRYGALVPMDDAVALADAMDHTLQTPTPVRPLQERAAEFSLTRITAEYAALFELSSSSQGRAAVHPPAAPVRDLSTQI